MGKVVGLLYHHFTGLRSVRQQPLTAGIAGGSAMDGRWWGKRSAMLREGGIQSVWGGTRLCRLRVTTDAELTRWLKLYTTARQESLERERIWIAKLLSETLGRGDFPRNLSAHTNVRICICISCKKHYVVGKKKPSVHMQVYKWSYSQRCEQVTKHTTLPTWGLHTHMYAHM